MTRGIACFVLFLCGACTVHGQHSKVLGSAVPDETSTLWSHLTRPSAAFTFDTRQITPISQQHYTRPSWQEQFWFEFKFNQDHDTPSLKPNWFMPNWFSDDRNPVTVGKRGLGVSPAKVKAAVAPMRHPTIHHAHHH